MGSCAMAAGLVGAQALAVSKDGRNVYVAADAMASTVTALERNPGTGLLSYSSCLVENNTSSIGCTATGRGIAGATDVAISADDKTVYTTARSTTHAVASFSRDLTANTPFGEAVQIGPKPAGCVSETGFDHDSGDSGGCANGRGLVSPFTVQPSPDGKNVYVAGSGSDALAILTPAANGDLAQAASTAGCLSNDPDGPGGSPPSDPECEGAFPLGGAGDVLVSPDSKSLYVGDGAFAQQALTIFDRDASGALTRLPGPDGCLATTTTAASLGCTSAEGFGLLGSSWISDDGGSVYVSAFLDRSVAELQRGLTEAAPGGSSETPTAPATGSCSGKPATLVGTGAAEKLKGTPGRDVIAALGGADTVNGRGGRDLICGGAGRDRLKGGGGNDKLLGQAGRDSLFGGGGKDLLNAGAGQKELCSGGGGRDKAKGCESVKGVP